MEKIMSRGGSRFSFRHRYLVTAGAIAALGVADVSVCAAQSAPDAENGRYALSKSGDDFVRLDTRTGVVSTCANKGGWVCRLVPDERTALDAEIGKLQLDNKSLKDQLAQRDTAPGKTDTPLAKEDSRKSAQESKHDSKSSKYKIELQLPADHEKLMAMLDKAWDRLVDMVARLQKKLSEKV